MEDKENKVKNQNKEDFDFTMFIGDEGANVLSTEQLKEIKKKLPNWSIMPPAKYKE
ncbi:MAG: hypothetical protein K2L70_03630 [Clostridia bacterium]|nr:hypothetical protein [Clostridia bacterium]